MSIIIDMILCSINNCSLSVFDILTMAIILRL